MGRLLRFVLVSALPLLPSGGDAHELWLVPSRHAAAAGDTVVLAAYAGTGFRGPRVPYPATRTEELALRGKRDLDLRRAAANGSLEWARWIAGDDRGSLVTFRSGFTPIQLTAGAFDAYLSEEGLEGPLRARARLGALAGPGRERFARCAKAWIAGRGARGVGDGGDPARATRPAGLPLEIVPLATPGVASTLRLRVLWRGRPLSNALIRAWTQPFEAGGSPSDPAARDSVAPALEARTAPDGTATVQVDRPGEWLVSAVHMVPSADRSVADWDSYWASLTFARTAPGP